MFAKVKDEFPVCQATAPIWPEQVQRHADEAISLLKAMANRNRLLLLCKLMCGEHSVGELAQTVGLAQATVSQHLSLRRRDGVVSGRREGQTIYYRISDHRVRALMTTLFEQFRAID